jgi:iron complex outermembrane recepter protein
MQARPLVKALAIAFGGVMVGSAFAQQPQEEPKQLQRVEVTGSSIKRIEGEGALPVTVLRRADIDRTGATTVADLLDKVGSNNGGGYSLGSALGDAGRPGFSGASLRALGSNNTLVLLNGRRLAVYAFDGGAVSLNDIPLDAIDRIEILRDGASHIYGTDAVAGVINLFTRRDYNGGEVRLGVQKTSDGGGGGKQVGATIGFGDLAANGYNVMINLGAVKFDGLKASERDFSKTAWIPGEGVNRLSANAFPANIGFSFGLRNPAAARYQLPTPFTPTPGGLGNAAFGTIPANAIPGGSQYGCLPPVSFSRTDADTTCRFDYASVINILPSFTRENAFLQGTYNVNANLKLSAEYAKARSNSTFTISQTPISEATTFNNDPVLLPASSRFYPTAWIAANFPAEQGKPLNLYYRSVEAGGRSNGAKSDQDRIVLEAEGSAGTIDYKVGFLQATSKVVESYKGGYISEAKIIPAFATGLINPFGPNTGAGLDALLGTQFIGVTRIGKSTVQILDGRMSTELAKLPAGSLGGAVGLEYRKEKYNDNPQAVLNTGDIIGGAGSQLPVAGSRKISAIYGELNIPIIKTVEALAALRYDKYSDFGNTTNPKLALRFQPTKEFLIRSSVGTGFRAPTLDNLFSQQTKGNTGGAYNDPFWDAQKDCNSATGGSGLYCNAQLTVKQGGEPNLKPEKSKSFTIGTLFEPTKDVSVGFDFFSIKQKGLIGIVSPDNKLSDFIDNFNPATLTSTSIYARDVITKIDNGTKVIDFVQSTFENLGEQKTKGVDITIKFRLPKNEIGDFRVNMEGSYIDSQRVRNPGDSQYGANGVGQYSRNGATLRWKHRSELVWVKGPWESNFAVNWQSGYVDQNARPNGDSRRVGASESYDVGVIWTGIKNFKLRGQVNNITNRQPPFSNQNDYFQVGYDQANTNPLGRTFRISGDYKFW